MADKKSLQALFVGLRSHEDDACCFLNTYEQIEKPENKYPLDFCQSYVIKLLKTYCKDTKKSPSANVWTIGSKEDKVELLLVTFGLLDGYERIKKLGQREMKYYEAAHSYNQLLKPKRESDPTTGTIIQNFNTISDALADELEVTLNEEMKKNKGVLGLIEKVPKKLTLPKPRSFSHTVARNQDTQKELDDSTEAISDYGQEETTAGIKNPESPQSSKSETFSSEEPQPDVTEKPPQSLPQDTDRGDFTSEKGNENVIKGNIDSHDMNIQIKYYIYSPQEGSPDSGVMERDPPSIEYSDPEPGPPSQYYLVEEDSSIGERVGQFFVKVKNWYCKQSKKTQKSKKAKMTKKAKTTLIIVSAAISVTIFAFIIRFNMNAPTSPSRTSSTGSQRSSLLDTSSNDSELLENQLIVTSEDMQEIINEARSSIEVLDESGEYDVESIKDLIFYRIVYNPVYGDMVVRGFWEADSFMQDKIGEGHPQLADFVSESSAALGENEPDTFIPDMSHWLIKISSQVSTTDNYKEYARFLCAMLENSFSEIRVDNFDSTSHWSIGGDAEGISVHAELVERSSNQPAIIFENIGDDNQLRYQVAFFLKDGSFATCNPWVKAQRSTENLGQERPSYTIEEVENGALGDKIVFNSISNGTLGDEKNFVSARPEDNPDGYECDDINIENGKEYIVRLYVHNNNPGGEEAVAENVRVAFALPERNAYAKDHQINGFIAASNATPNEYWDYINFHSDTCFKLTYVPDSAKIENTGFANEDVDDYYKKLSNSVVKTLDDPDGVLIGYEQAGDGKIPGGFEYDQIITIRVKAEYPDFMIQQQVRLVGEEEWKYEVDAEIGDEVEFRIEYKNIDDEEKMHKDVMIKDIMPEGLCYLGGSTMLYNVSNPDGLKIDQDSLVYTGINIGRYATGANGVVFFKARVVDESLEYGSNALVNWALGGVGHDTLSDYAVVMVNKE